MIQQAGGSSRWDLGQHHDGVVALVEVHTDRASPSCRVEEEVEQGGRRLRFFWYPYGVRLPSFI